jgi:hypothetical protein
MSEPRAKAQVRDSVRALLAQPGSVDTRDLWTALAPPERIRAIVQAVRRSDESAVKAALLKRAGKALNWRPQKLPVQITALAPRLERSGALEGFEPYLLGALWVDVGISQLFSAVYERAEIASGISPTGNVPQSFDLAEIMPLILRAVAIDTELALLFLLDFARICAPWRDALHSWLASLDDASFAALHGSVVQGEERLEDLSLFARGGVNYPKLPIEQLADFEKQVEHLRSTFEDLAAWMESVSIELRELETPPPTELARKIDATIAEFDQLRDEVLAQQAHGDDLDQADRDLPSLVRIGAVLTSRRVQAQDRELRQNVYERARAVLECASRLETTHASVEPALGKCREAAFDLLGRIESEMPEQQDTLAALDDGRHPFSLLVARVGVAQQSVEEELILDAWLREQFGPALAIAVMSGRVALPVQPTNDERVAPVETPDGAASESGKSPAGAVDTRVTPPEVSLDGATVTSSMLERELGPHGPAYDGGLDSATAATVHGIVAVSGTPDTQEERQSSELSSPMLDEAGDEAELATTDHAEAIANSPTPPAYASAAWDLLRAGKIAIAYHMVRVQGNAPIPPAVLKALVLGREIRTGLGEIAQALREPFEWVGNDYLPLESGEERATHLLIAASALRPALIAPITGGAAILRQLRLEGALYGFVQTVASYGERLNGLDPAALGRALSVAQWDEEQKKLQNDVEHYLEQAGLRTILYARATDVLRIWTREEGLIHRLLTPILTDDAESLATALEQIQTVDIEREVNRTDKILRAGRREPIQARALESLRNYFNEAAEFLWRWQSLQSLRPKSDHYQQTLIQELRHEFQAVFPSIEKELREIAKSPEVEFEVGATLLHRAVGDLKAVVINGTGLGVLEPSPVHLLNSVLLRTTIPLRRGLEPAGSDAHVEDALHALLLDEPEWTTALENRMAARDFEGARRLVDYLRDTHNELAPDFADRWNRAANTGLHSLAHDLAETRRRLEEHVSKGLVREGDRSIYDATLVEVERHIVRVRKLDGRVNTSLTPDEYRFNEEHERLTEIREALDASRRDRTDGILLRLQASNLSPETVLRIKTVLARGDFLTAEEYIDLAESQQLPADVDEHHDAFSEFYPHSARSLERYLDEYAPPLVVEHLRERLVIPGLRIERLDINQARQAAELMAVWYEMKRQRDFKAEQVIRLMTGLGFRPIEAVASEPGHVPQIHVRAQPIADRTEIPVEFFGSRANGHYRLLGIWDRRSEEEISGIVGDSHGESATIVCFFGRLTEQQRSGLGDLARRSRRTFVVLDELLLLFLCGQPGSRLPVLFQCTLPFTHLDPYITTGSLVPPEMFFGRERERDQIIDPNGPSVLYGGRQLGKTALLRHVKRMYHNPEKGWIVRWIDLRAEGVGYYRGTEEIWPILVRELIRYGILTSRIPSTTGPERIIELVRDWLGSVHGRRIVLLLDEADRFLERDAKDEFRQTALLKKLMDQTGRAFKVVFAGLHNVYRTANDPNHPIGHFGNPIQIGPLIDNGEARSARALIADPFSLVGYRFESTDLISRILAETNYYPSLLQLYGAHLLKHLAERQARAERFLTPPIKISHEDVEDASRGQDLREAIHQRFALTLQLDPRYEVIAYSLAHAILEHSLTLDQGGSAEWIRRDALYWWPEGFEITSGPELRVLLDEMVGLGVLRSTGASYTFRNANVLLLMGTEEEIRTSLLRERPAPPIYEAATFREIIRAPSMRMSPLTAQQLGSLRQGSNGITILIGSEANDLSSVPEFLTRFFGNEYVRTVEGLSNHRDFVRWLADLRQTQERHGTTFVIVGPDVPWARSWVQGADEWLSKRRSRELALKIVFIADPDASRRLSDLPLDELIDTNFRLLELSPWHDSAVNQWLDANNVASSPTVRQRIAEVTGNRPYLLYRYVEKFNKTFTWEQPLNELEQELTAGPLRKEVLDALGVGDPSALQTRILQTLAMLGEPTDVQDLAMLLENEHASTDLIGVLRWAEHLHLVKRSAADTWVLDALVHRLLSESAS